jgi:hypothetical protein
MGRNLRLECWAATVNAVTDPCPEVWLVERGITDPRGKSLSNVTALGVTRLTPSRPARPVSPNWPATVGESSPRRAPLWLVPDLGDGATTRWPIYRATGFGTTRGCRRRH